MDDTRSVRRQGANPSRSRWIASGLGVALSLCAASTPAAAQGSTPPSAYPPAPYPPLPAPPYSGPSPQGYPPAPYPAPPPTGYAPQPLPSPFPAPAPVLQPPRPPPSRYRSPGEMVFLYGAGAAYGFGTGMWMDAVAHVTDPGVWILTPLALGAAVPISTYLWDYNEELDKGVPSSIATGLLLGGVEGVALSGLQWQDTGGAAGGPSQWDYPTWATITFLTATGGAIGGYAFGEWLQPDARTLGFIGSGAGWGSVFGVLFGAGVAPGDWKSGSALWGFLGYNAGIAATGALSTFYTPSWTTLEAMWLGDLIGTVATTPIYLFYIDSKDDPRHGLIANSLGGLAGLGVAAALTANMTDPPDSTSWAPPFHLALAPSQGGAQLQAFGAW